MRRNAIKRRVREAFRHLQHDLDRGYDLVVTVKQHVPMPMREYQSLLQDAAADLMRKWARRERRSEERPT